MSWTEERVASLKKLWLEGLTASQVARQLGGVTRSSVIGKVHRLGMSTRGVASKPAGKPTATTVKPVKADKPVIVAPSIPSAAQLGPTGQKLHRAMVAEALKAEPVIETKAARREVMTAEATLSTLAAHSCRWPIGNPAATDFGFCGRKKVRGSYCETHAARAFQPMPAPLKVGNLPGWAR